MSRDGNKSYGNLPYAVFGFIILALLIIILLGGLAIGVALAMPIILLLLFAFTPLRKSVPFWQIVGLLLLFMVVPYILVRYTVIPMSAAGAPLTLSTITLTYDTDMMYAFTLVVIAIVFLAVFRVRYGHGGR